ncbi:unnamed protein product [Owenia fusiformis]|uniref:Uncharacterized protein n=1 Tax=Owenia fusiformis TaxID=6347 RepID=A0A8J1XZV4_OWEFU|nr:unnamed protein product [Owenia fusiformis]
MEFNEDDISIIDDTVDVVNDWPARIISGSQQFHMRSGEESVSLASLHALQTAYTDLKKRYHTLEKKQLQTQQVVKSLLQDSRSMEIVSNGFDDIDSGRPLQNGHPIRIRSSGSLDHTRNGMDENDGKRHIGGDNGIRKPYIDGNQREKMQWEQNERLTSNEQYKKLEEKNKLMEIDMLKFNDRYKQLEEENKQLLIEIDTMKNKLECSEAMKKEEVKVWKEQYQKLKLEFDTLLQQSKTEGKLDFNEDSMGSSFSEELQKMQEQLVKCQQEVRMLRRLVEEQKNAMLEAIKREEDSLREKRRKGSSGRGSLSSGPNSPVPGYIAPGINASMPPTQGGMVPGGTRQRNSQTTIINQEPQTYLGVQESAATIPDRIAPEDVARVVKWPGQGPQTLVSNKDTAKDTPLRQDSDAEMKKALEESLKVYKQEQELRKQRQSLSNDPGMITKSVVQLGDSSVPLGSSPKVSMVPGSVSYSTRSRLSPLPTAPSQTTQINESQPSVEEVTNDIVIKGGNMHVTTKRSGRGAGLNIHRDTIAINPSISDSVFIHDGSGGARSKVLRSRGQSEDIRPIHALEMMKPRPISSSYGDRMEIECRGLGGPPEAPTNRPRSRERDHTGSEEPIPQGNAALEVHIDDIATVGGLERSESLEVLNVTDEEQGISPENWHPTGPTENDESEGSPVDPIPASPFGLNNLSAYVDTRHPSQLNPNSPVSNNSTRVPSNQRALNIERNEPNGARPRGYDNAGNNVNLNMGAKDKIRETTSPSRPILNNNPLVEMKNISSRNIFKESDRDRLGGKDARCPNCNMHFSSMMTKDDVQQHMLECNGDSPGEEERTCPMCNAVFPSAVPQGEFEQHVNEHFSVNEDFVHLG